MLVDWILCHWVSRTAAEVKTCEQELITELPTVRVIEVLWEHTTLFRTQFEERTVRSGVMVKVQCWENLFRREVTCQNGVSLGDIYIKVWLIVLIFGYSWSS